MSTTLTRHHTPAAAPAGVRRLALEVSDCPDVLARVIGVCLRRRCDLREVVFRRATPAAPATIELSLLVGPRQDGPLRDWLAGLVDVRAVRESI